MPSPETVMYVAGALVTALLAYTSKRLLSVADRLDAVLVTIAGHEIKIGAIQEALGRGRIRMDDIDKHLRTTDGEVSNQGQRIARIEGDTK